MEYDVVLGVWVFDESLTFADLASYMGLEVGSDGYDSVQLDRSLNSSYSLIEDVLRNCYVTRPMPQALFEQAVLEVAHEIHKRKNSPTGQDQFVQYNGGGAPTRGPRDPLTQVYPLLQRYAGLGVA
jgi:hypothetical protein